MDNPCESGIQAPHSEALDRPFRRDHAGDSERKGTCSTVTRQVTLTTDGASVFLSWLEAGDEKTLERLMEHPGYRARLSYVVGFAEARRPTAGAAGRALES